MKLENNNSKQENKDENNKDKIENPIEKKNKTKIWFLAK